MPLVRAFTDIGLGASRAMAASLQVTPRLPSWNSLPGTAWVPVMDIGARLAWYGRSFVQQTLRELVPAASGRQTERADPGLPRALLGLSVVPDIAALVITTGKKKGRHPSPATVMRMLRDQEEQTVHPDRS